MFHRFSVLAIAAVAVCAQQSSPDQAEAEKSLRERVQQFYQLQVDKKFREAEGYVATDTKDLFYNSAKPDIPSFRIENVKMLDGTHAEVRVSAKMSIFIMGKGMVPMELPTTGSWKIENGQWVWFVDQTAGIKTPFGVIKPTAGNTVAGGTPDIAGQIKNVNLSAIRNQVTVEPTAVELSEERPVQSVTISNSMPGAVALRLETNFISGVSVKLDKTEVNSGEKATVVFTRQSDGGPASGVTKVDVTPLNTILEVQVSRR